MASVRLALSAGLLALAQATPALAQHCEPESSDSGEGVHVAFGASAESAGYDNARYEGHYEGLALRAGLSTRWASLTASGRAYRIVRNGISAAGLGDSMFMARVPLVASGTRAISAGIFGGVGLPTGDADHDLGMGHVMLMGSGWLDARFADLFGEAQLGYGRALASGGAHAHHHGDDTPIVDPMLESELEWLGTVEYALEPRLRVRGAAFGAAAVGGATGKARAIAAAGVRFAAGNVGTGFDVELPFVGDPFTSKLRLSLETRF